MKSPRSVITVFTIVAPKKHQCNLHNFDYAWCEQDCSEWAWWDARLRSKLVLPVNIMPAIWLSCFLPGQLCSPLQPCDACLLLSDRTATELSQPCSSELSFSPLTPASLPEECESTLWIVFLCVCTCARTHTRATEHWRCSVLCRGRIILTLRMPVQLL